MGERFRETCPFPKRPAPAARTLMAHNGTALKRSNRNLRSTEGQYPGLRDTVRWVAEYSLRGQSRRPVQDAAIEAIKEAGVEPVPVTQQDLAWKESAARAVYRWMGSRIRYAHDPEGIEQVQEPTATLALGQGDCDDMVSLAVAMLTGLGVPARIKVIRQEGSDVFNHIYAQYKGLQSGRAAWKDFDPTLHRPSKGERGSAGDGPGEGLIAEAVVVPVTGAPGRLGQKTKAALSNLPADAGVVPDSTLQREKSNQPSPSSMQGSSRRPLRRNPSADSQGTSAKLNQEAKVTSSGEESDPGDLLNSASAPGSSKSMSAVPKLKEEVVLVPPGEYAQLIEQAVETGDYECTVEGQIVIRDEQGKEILPAQEGGIAEAGIGQWVLGFLVLSGGVALLASLSSEERDSLRAAEPEE